MIAQQPRRALCRLAAGWNRADHNFTFAFINQPRQIVTQPVGVLLFASAEFDMYQPRVDYHADRGDADVEASEQLSQMVDAYSVSVIAVDNPAITDDSTVCFRFIFDER